MTRGSVRFRPKAAELKHVGERGAERREMENVGVDRLQALAQGNETVVGGGTILISGVFGVAADPLNMLQPFDKDVKLVMGRRTSNGGSVT